IREHVKKFKAFDFEVIAINGHNYEQIGQPLQETQNPNGNPFAIIAKTFKGYGVSFLKNKDGWHGKALKKEELEKALKGLGPINDDLRFDLKKPDQTKLPRKSGATPATTSNFEQGKEYA